MFSKQFLTLACVIGILAFGGCIFIPEGKAPLPAPPPIAWQGIQAIQVAAVNSSELHHVDSDELAQAVIRDLNMNVRTLHAGIKAKAQMGGEAGDALLKIAILNETATVASGGTYLGKADWTFVIRISATLIKPDGSLVWSQTDKDYSFSRAYRREDPAAVWKESGLSHSLNFELSERLVYRMLDTR